MTKYKAIREKLVAFNARLFQKKEGSRISLFLAEEQPLLAPLPVQLSYICRQNAIFSPL